VRTLESSGSTPMIEEIIGEKVRALPLDKKQEVLDFVEFLEQRRSPSQPRRSPEGLWADLTVNVGKEEITEEIA